MINLENLSALY